MASGQPILNRWQVVYCHHLHTQTTRKEIGGPNKNDDYQVMVEGKKRPMLIIGQCYRIKVETAKDTREPSNPDDTGKPSRDCFWYQADARKAYWMLPLQSKVPYKYRREFLQLPFGCLDLECPTVVQLTPVSYPVDLVCEWRKVERRLPDDAVDEIVKELNLRRLGMPSRFVF